MADFDDGWGDDPFEGDFSFDDDFDKPGGKKGFIRNFASGFLSGLVSKSVGDTEARMNTLRMALPKTFTGSLNNIQSFNRERAKILEEIKGESYQAVQDLQYLAKRAAAKLQGGATNKISTGLLTFSSRDFSSWEKTDYSSGDDSPSLEDTKDEEVDELIANQKAEAKLGRKVAQDVGIETIAAMSQIGGKTIGGITALNTASIKTNQLLTDLLNHQRRVKARHDAMQLNVLTRTYLTNVKYFRFVEASNHRIISELKEINQASKMSDYEKTSHSEALRKTLRDSFFNTAKEKFGGIRGFVQERFGKNARSEATGLLGELTGNLRMASEMSEGMPINMGGMLGEAAAGIFINNLPRMIKSKRGQEYVNKFKKQFPDQAKFAEQAYKKLTDFGNVATYATDNAEGIANTLARHYQGGYGADEFKTYEDYLSEVQGDSRVLSKGEWTILNAAKKAGNKAIGGVLDNTWSGGGSQYSLSNRSLADSFENTLWTRRDSRALSEEIPQWLSQIHLSIEKMRTGNDGLKAISYDYTRGSFLKHDQKINMVKNRVLDRNQFGGQARMANNVVDSIDEFKALSPKAKQELSYRLIKDTDAGQGFSPYNYLNLENEGVDPTLAAEIKAIMQANFDITDDTINSFRNGDDLNRLKMITSLPSERARSRVTGLNQQAKSLTTFAPDISKNIDVLKGSGFYTALKEAGIISRVNGRDEVNESLMDETLRKFIENPDAQASDLSEESDKDLPTLAGGRRRANNLPADALERLNTSISGLSGLSTGIGTLNESIQRQLTQNNPGLTTDLLPLSTGMDAVNEKLNKLIEMADIRNTTLIQLLEKQPTTENISPQKAEEIKRTKQSMLERIKQFSFKDMFNKGVDKVLDNEPLILGGLLGGLAGLAVHNPKAAALLGGGAAIAVGYNKLRGMAKGRNPEDTEDLYEEGSDVPILEAFKLRRGDYLDMTTGFILDSWKKISGSVRDITNNTIIGSRRLAGKLFTAENKEVFLQGLSKIRDLAVKAFNKLDPIGRLMRLKDAGFKRVNQIDVYKEGSDTPTLIGKSFEGGAYWKRSNTGEMVQLTGWNDIDGPVYDREGNVLITQEDYDRGLRTAMGVSINKLGNAGKKAGSYGLDLLGKLRAKIDPTLANAKDKFGDLKDGAVGAFKADYSPIVSSVDRIHNLLLRHWGYPNDTPNGGPEGQPPGMLKTLAEKVGPVKERLNSLADKERQEKEEKDNNVKDAIINIAGNFGFGSKNAKDDAKKERFGLFSLLSGGFGMLKTAIMGVAGTLLSGVKLLGTFASVGIRMLPLIAGGIATVAKLMYALVAKTGRGVSGMLGGNEVGPDGKPTKRGRRIRGGLKLGAGLAAGFAIDALVNNGTIEEGGMVETAANTAATVAGVYGTAQMLGLTTAGVTAGVGTATAAAGTALSAGWGLAAPLLFNPVTLGVLAVGALGYGIYRYATRGSGKQVELRLTQYGISDPDSDLAKKVLKVEELLTDYVVIGNGKASLSSNAPLQDVINLFITDKQNQQETGSVFSWFNGRFKPVFLTYMACLDAVKLKGFKEYDERKDKVVLSVAKQAHQALTGILPFPYTIVAKIDQETLILPEKQTVIRVNQLLEELTTYVDRHTSSGDKEAIPTPKAAGDLQQEKATLEAQLKDPKETWGRSIEANTKEVFARKRLDEVNSEISKLNSAYKPGSVIEQVYIKDLLPEDRAMDLMTAIRVACYGNSNDIPWRVEAVLKLERHCESLFTVSNEGAKFNGQIGQLFGMFKDAFRVDQNDGDKWCLWFRDRFLPVLTSYMNLVNRYRRGRPGVVWKSLSATARFEIAKELAETMVVINPTYTASIWDVRAAPFKGQYSPGRSDKVARMLNLLSEASNTAKLKDPEGEAGRTNASSWAKTVEPHKVGGGYTKEQFNLQTADQAKTRREVGLGGQYSTNTVRSFGSGNVYDMNGASRSAGNQYNFNPISGSSDTSHLDMSGVENKGNDTGIKVPKKLAEQLLVREMLKQGFTDPREIALVLSLNNYESGGFGRSVENMKYSSPERLVKMFREVKSVEQARQLIKAGEVAIANTVYGGGKGKGLGNVNPGDGWKYRGRGFTQLTGKANYQKVGDALGIDLVNNPQIASEDPNVMAAIAVNFFKTNKQLRSIAAGAHFTNAARGLNGGLHLPGMATRQGLYNDYLAKLQNGTLNTKDNEEGAPETLSQSAGGIYGGGTPSTTPPPSGGPTVGLGNTPTIAPNPSGGGYSSTGSGGYAGYGGAPTPQTQQPLVKNYTSGSSGLRIKSEEAVGGGAHHPAIERLGELIQTQVPYFHQFTALNDRFHQGRPGNSKHKDGLALDFTITNGAQGSAIATNKVTEILRQAGLTQAEFFVLDEYRKPSAGATGGHIHFHFNSAAAAKKFLDAAGGTANAQDTTTGGLVQRSEPSAPTITPMPQPQATPTVAPQGNNTTAQPPEQTIPTERAPATTPKENVQPKVPGSDLGKRAPEAANQSFDMDGLGKALTTAIDSGDKESAKMLAAILLEIRELNKNLTTQRQEHVNMG